MGKCCKVMGKYCKVMGKCREVMGKQGVLNGGLAYGLYDVNQIPLTSDPMPTVLLSDPMIRIPLS